MTNKLKPHMRAFGRLPKEPRFNMTGYTGVAKTRQGRYRAFVTWEKQRDNLGTYDTPRQAAIARDRFIIKCNLPIPLQVLRRTDVNTQGTTKDKAMEL